MPSTSQARTSAVAFWQDVWAALRLAERYVPLDGLDAYQVTPKLTGEILRPLLESRGDIRMHVSNGALASFAGTLPLLHPFGRLLCHDLFLTAPPTYHTGFHGPGKYDGSVVNWVNGPLLAAHRQPARLRRADRPADRPPGGERQDAHRPGAGLMAAPRHGPAAHQRRAPAPCCVKPLATPSSGLTRCRSGSAA